MQKELNKPESMKDEYIEKSNQVAPKQQLSKDESTKILKENLPYMRLQDEYDEIIFKMDVRRISRLEMNVREIEAVSYLTEWKRGQETAKQQHDMETSAKQAWDAMTPEEQVAYQAKAEAIMKGEQPIETATGNQGGPVGQEMATGEGAE